MVLVYLHQRSHVLPMLRPLFGNHNIIVLNQPPQGLLAVQPPTFPRRYMACVGRPGRLLQRTEPMPMDVSLVVLEEVRGLRDLCRQEMNCQSLLDSWHERGWTDSYLFRIDGRVVGYGLVGGVGANPKHGITEFVVLPVHRAAALPLFGRLAVVRTCRASANLLPKQYNDGQSLPVSLSRNVR